MMYKGFGARRSDRKILLERASTNFDIEDFHGEKTWSETSET
jgi:hypothetical protein